MKTIHHTVNDPNGIHARPAGVIVNTSKKFTSEINLICGDKSGNCKKIFSVMGMALKFGDEFIIQISGEDEDAAAAALTEALETSEL